MGGKRLKFPRRQKYEPPVKNNQSNKKPESINEEEHKKRLKILKEIGILKD